MSRTEVIVLMESSKSETEWNANCDTVKRAFPDKNGRSSYPEFWYPVIIASGLINRVRASWGAL